MRGGSRGVGPPGKHRGERTRTRPKVDEQPGPSRRPKAGEYANPPRGRTRILGLLDRQPVPDARGFRGARPPGLALRRTNTKAAHGGRPAWAESAAEGRRVRQSAPRPNQNPGVARPPAGTG